MRTPAANRATRLRVCPTFASLIASPLFWSHPVRNTRSSVTGTAGVGTLQLGANRRPHGEVFLAFRLGPIRARCGVPFWIARWFRVIGRSDDSGIPEAWARAHPRD